MSSATPAVGFQLSVTGAVIGPALASAWVIV
ncbi:hypothetical protein FHR55_001252 [Xanthomonas arboricola]